MVIKKVITVPNPILRQKSKPVKKIDKKVETIIKDLKDTLASEQNPKGIGISAPQIGKSWQVCLAFSKKEKKVLAFINPEIVWNSKKMTNKVPESENPYEGCLSVPGYWGPVKRYKEVKVRYLTPANRTVTRKFSGLTGVVVQHEIDHLNGILFVDRILKQGGKLYKQEKDEEGGIVFVELELE